MQASDFDLESVLGNPCIAGLKFERKQAVQRVSSDEKKHSHRSRKQNDSQENS